LVSMALARHQRKNETFWKVFSNIINKVKHEFTENELIDLASILDANNGKLLY